MIYPIPTGTRDMLPDEVSDVTELVAKLRGTFKANDYREISTPTLEYEKTIATGDPSLLASSYRLGNSDGDVLVLRPDMTVPIARVVATRYREAQPPLRFSAIGPVFRIARPLQSQLCESLQAGIELIGDKGIGADAEVLTVLFGALEKIGLGDFKIGIGDARLYRSLLKDLNVADERIVYELVTRDLVGLEREVKALNLDPEMTKLLIDMPRLRGGAEVFERLTLRGEHEQFAAAVSDLRALEGRLREVGISEHIIFDLGLLRGLGYYTGLIFDAYDARSGMKLGGGGRYDELLARFGKPMPAVGFDLSVEQLQLALERQE